MLSKGAAQATETKEEMLQTGQTTPQETPTSTPTTEYASPDRTRLSRVIMHALLKHAHNAVLFPFIKKDPENRWPKGWTVDPEEARKKNETIFPAFPSSLGCLLGKKDGSIDLFLDDVERRTKIIRKNLKTLSELKETDPGVQECIDELQTVVPKRREEDGHSEDDGHWSSPLPYYSRRLPVIVLNYSKDARLKIFQIGNVYFAAEYNEFKSTYQPIVDYYNVSLSNVKNKHVAKIDFEEIQRIRKSFSDMLAAKALSGGNTVHLKTITDSLRKYCPRFNEGRALEHFEISQRNLANLQNHRADPPKFVPVENSQRTKKLLLAIKDVEVIKQIVDRPLLALIGAMRFAQFIIGQMERDPSLHTTDSDWFSPDFQNPENIYKIARAFFKIAQNDEDTPDDEFIDDLKNRLLKHFEKKDSSLPADLKIIVEQIIKLKKAPSEVGMMVNFAAEGKEAVQAIHKSDDLSLIALIAVANTAYTKFRESAIECDRQNAKTHLVNGDYRDPGKLTTFNADPSLVSKEFEDKALNIRKEAVDLLKIFILGAEQQTMLYESTRVLDSYIASIVTQQEMEILLNEGVNTVPKLREFFDKGALELYNHYHALPHGLVFLRVLAKIGVPGAMELFNADDLINPEKSHVNVVRLLVMKFVKQAATLPPSYQESKEALTSYHELHPVSAVPYEDAVKFVLPAKTTEVGDRETVDATNEANGSEVKDAPNNFNAANRKFPSSCLTVVATGQKLDDDNTSLMYLLGSNTREHTAFTVTVQEVQDTIKKGVDWRARNVHGLTALHFALRHSNLNVILHLLSLYIKEACQNGNTEILKLNLLDKDGNIIPEVVIANFCQVLEKLGINFDNTHTTLLHVICQNVFIRRGEWNKLISNILSTYPKILAVQDDEGNTPLHLAVEVANRIGYTCKLEDWGIPIPGYSSFKEYLDASEWNYLNLFIENLKKMDRSEARKILQIQNKKGNCIILEFLEQAKKFKVNLSLIFDLYTLYNNFECAHLIQNSEGFYLSELVAPYLEVSAFNNSAPKKPEIISVSAEVKQTVSKDDKQAVIVQEVKRLATVSEGKQEAKVPDGKQAATVPDGKQSALALPDVKFSLQPQQGARKDFFTKFMEKTEEEQKAILYYISNRHNDMDLPIIVDGLLLPCTEAILVDLGILPAKEFSCFRVGPAIPFTAWSLEPFIREQLRVRPDAKYFIFTIPTLFNGFAEGHSVPVVIDRVTKQMFCFDPQANRNGGEKEALDRLKALKKNVPEFNDYTIPSPPENWRLNPPQQIGDEENCALISFNFFLGIVSWLRKANMHSDALNMLKIWPHIDFTDPHGMPPRTREQLRLIIGGMVLAHHSHYQKSERRKARNFKNEMNLVQNKSNLHQSTENNFARIYQLLSDITENNKILQSYISHLQPNFANIPADLKKQLEKIKQWDVSLPMTSDVLDEITGFTIYIDRLKDLVDQELKAAKDKKGAANSKEEIAKYENAKALLKDIEKQINVLANIAEEIREEHNRRLKNVEKIRAAQSGNFNQDSKANLSETKGEKKNEPKVQSKPQPPKNPAAQDVEAPASQSIPTAALNAALVEPKQEIPKKELKQTNKLFDISSQANSSLSAEDRKLAADFRQQLENKVKGAALPDSKGNKIFIDALLDTSKRKLSENKNALRYLEDNIFKIKNIFEANLFIKLLGEGKLDANQVMDQILSHANASYNRANIIIIDILEYPHLLQAVNDGLLNVQMDAQHLINTYNRVVFLKNKKNYEAEMEKMLSAPKNQDSLNLQAANKAPMAPSGGNKLLRYGGISVGMYAANGSEKKDAPAASKKPLGPAKK